MKKIIKLLSIILMIVLLSGCGKSKVGISELEIESDHVASWISGTIQNNTNKEYYMTSVDIILKNGSVTKECSFTVSDLKAKETKDFSELIIGCDGDLENYKVSVKNIEPYEKTK